MTWAFHFVLAGTQQMEPAEASWFSERQETQQSQSMEGQLVLTFYVVLSQKYTKSALTGRSSAFIFGGHILWKGKQCRCWDKQALEFSHKDCGPCCALLWFQGLSTKSSGLESTHHSEFSYLIEVILCKTFPFSVMILVRASIKWELSARHSAKHFKYLS